MSVYFLKTADPRSLCVRSWREVTPSAFQRLPEAGGAQGQHPISAGRPGGTGTRAQVRHCRRTSLSTTALPESWLRRHLGAPISHKSSPERRNLLGIFERLFGLVFLMKSSIFSSDDCGNPAPDINGVRSDPVHPQPPGASETLMASLLLMRPLSVPGASFVLDAPVPAGPSEKWPAAPHPPPTSPHPPPTPPVVCTIPAF